jgi:hypothetical protein
MLSLGQVSLIVCSYYFPDVQFWEALVLIDEGAQSLTSSSTTAVHTVHFGHQHQHGEWRENPTQQVLCFYVKQAKNYCADRSVHC